eukprot:3709879-Amphidinium_carterae.1
MLCETPRPEAKVEVDADLPSRAHNYIFSSISTITIVLIRISKKRQCASCMPLLSDDLGLMFEICRLEVPLLHLAKIEGNTKE